MTINATPPPDAMALADFRARYEKGEEPIKAIANDAGVSPVVLARKAKALGWILRGKARAARPAKTELTRATIKRLKNLLQTRLAQLETQLGDFGADVSALSGERDMRAAENIRMLFQHNPAEPVGTWLELRETERGLYVLGRLDSNVQRGRELLSLLECSGINGLSIGFRIILAKTDRSLATRRLIAVDLWEISSVGVGGYVGGRSLEKIAAQTLPQRGRKQA